MMTEIFASAECILPNTYIVAKLPTPKQVREHSKTQPGQWFLTDISLIQVVGSNAPQRWLLAEEAAAQLENAKRVKALTGLSKVGPTYGSQARALVEWLGWNNPYTLSDQTTFRTILGPYHYQFCRAKFTCPWLGMYDLKSAYWQMIGRMPSPLVTLHSGGAVQFHKVRNPDRLSKWRELVTFVGESDKLFRLVFVGVCAAGCHNAYTVSYSKGREMKPHLRTMNALTGAAVLAVRSTYEVTQEQRRALDCRYANADCIITDKPEQQPALWQALGLDYGGGYKVKDNVTLTGPGSVRGVGVYKIGEFQTERWALMPNPRWYHNFTGKIVQPVYHKSFL